MATRITLMALAIALGLAGCAAGPNLTLNERPALPATWRDADAQANAQADAHITRDWWRSFGSAELDRLIETARTQSRDLAAAVARVRQAEASARIAGADLLPRLDASGNATRQSRMSTSHAGNGGRVTDTTFSAGLNAAYEVDFWGRNHALRDSAHAGLEASRFDRDTVELTLTAGTASAWLQTVALLERSAIASRNLDSANRLLALVEARSRAGAATPLELAQQRGLVASQRRTVAALHQRAAEAHNALAVLLGQAAEPVLGTTTLADLRPPAIGSGVPSMLLTRRPDLARAEARLTAAAADIRAARAAMLPRLTLTASLGTGGDQLRHIFDNPLYLLAAGLAAPIFDASRLAAQRDLTLARREELLATYQHAIISAFADVQAALHATTGLDAQRDAQAVEMEQAQRALRLAESRYRAGADTLLTLLDAQRTLYAAQDAAVQLRAARLQAAVGVYRALGGGWEREDPLSPMASEALM